MRHDISSNRTRLLVTAALFAAVITLTTAYLLHIPVPTGYVHLGDAFVYLAASLLPAPYAVAAAAIGVVYAVLARALDTVGLKARLLSR